MTGSMRFSLAVSALVILGSQRVWAQPQHDGATRWSVKVADAAPLNDEPGAYRVFGSPDELTLIVAIPSPAFRGQLRLKLQQDREIPVVATWAPEPGIESGRAIEWAVALSREDRRPLRPGRYVLEVATGAGAQRTRLRLDVGPPVNARERATALRVEAQKLQKENPSEAITLLHLALATDPADAENSVALGDSYVQAGRYLEAVPFFERAIQILPRDKQTVHYSLALAYVGMGDEGAAAQALRDGGISGSGVSDRLAQYRRTITYR